MAVQTIVDEVNSGLTATVTGGKALKVEPRYFWYYTTSATSTAAIYAGAGVVHTVTQGASAAAAILAIYDGTTAAAIGSDLEIANFQGGTNRGSNILDAIFSTGLTFRLSGAVGASYTITYSKGA